ncbi:hypothetical protein ACQPYK_15170 [Streptosporangium sp. CA-135522]|uniref:hypothetical protein n=1 Tax=Streptosporangium sp. CA-135522 TaxID=3240072 RepID=UPI003D8B3C76
MILISAGLVVTAIVLLIAGFVLAKPFLVMWSIAVSVLSAVFLVIGALLRRHELFPGRERAGSAPLPSKGPVPAGPMPAPHMMPPHRQAPPAPHAGVPQGTPRPATVATRPRPSQTAGPVPAARQGLLGPEAIVLVIPGRKRYHVAGCRQLVGRDHEELTHEEAREEGFTPCTTCLPEFSGGTQPQNAPDEAQETAKPPLSSQESSLSAEAREAGVHEPTARFGPPYAPVPSSGSQESQESAVAVTRPYIPGTPQSGDQARSEEPASPSRAAESAGRSFSARPPAPEPETSADSETSNDPETSADSETSTSADSEATSWFSRDVVASVASEPEPEELDEPEEFDELKGETPAEPPSAEDDSAGPAGSSTASPEPEVIIEIEDDAPIGDVDGPADPAPAEQEEPDAPAEADSAESGPSEPDTPVTTTTRSAGQEASEKPSPAKRKAPGRPASVEPDSPSEPVEPVDTAPGRAGQVTADSTSAEPQEAPQETSEEVSRGVSAAEDEEVSVADDEGISGADDEDTDTAPHGIPVVMDEQPDSDDSGTVKVIVGTRRFHSSACPLIKGTDGSGIETMSRSEAEEAGLSSCSVCRDGG